MELRIDKIVCGYGKKIVAQDISFSVNAGEVLCLLGPNGAGKTTLFKTILGFLKKMGGSIMLDGENIENWKIKQLARAVGYVPQAHTPPFPYTVQEVILMGRTAHMGDFSMPSEKDRVITEDVIQSLGIGFLKERVYTQISGGERQMVLIARALAQQPKLLVLDEPTSNLDFGNQMHVLKQIKRLAEGGMGVIMTTHFPDHAYLCSSQVALIKKDGFYIGTPDEVMTEAKLKEVYGIDVKISSIMDGGLEVKTCIPLLH